MGQKPSIVLRSVDKEYHRDEFRIPVLVGLDLTVSEGEFLALMGPSGSGKSTLMHLLGALDTPTSGEVFFQGRALHTLADRELALLRRQRIGFIFQFFNLLPTLTAVENVALPLLLAGYGRRKALPPAHAVLDRIGLAERAGHFPTRCPAARCSASPSPAPW